MEERELLLQEDVGKYVQGKKLCLATQMQLANYSQYDIFTSSTRRDMIDRYTI